MPKKPSLKTLRKKAITLAKDYAKARDNYVCYKCQERTEGRNCHGAHVIPETRSQWLACDPLNIITLCYQHHLWWHESPAESGVWYTQRFPATWILIQDQLAEVEARKPPNSKDWAVIIEELQKRMETYDGSSC